MIMGINYKKILKENFPARFQTIKDKKLLFIVLGSLGDFDSFEYCQQLASKMDNLTDRGIEVFVTAIGQKSALKRFCSFTQFPEERMELRSNRDLHAQLGLNDGLNFHVSPILNILFMCLGLKSPGTIREVLRGYVGDMKAPRIFSTESNIEIRTKIPFVKSLFSKFGDKTHLLPFELATLRLINMIEILSNWSIYVPFVKHINQRGGTFLFDDDGSLIYTFFASSLLNYSETMSLPLTFLDKLDIMEKST